MASDESNRPRNEVSLDRLRKAEARVFEAFRRIGNGEARTETRFVREGAHTYTVTVKPEGTNSDNNKPGNG